RGDAIKHYRHESTTHFVERFLESRLRNDKTNWPLSSSGLKRSASNRGVSPLRWSRVALGKIHMDNDRQRARRQPEARKPAKLLVRQTHPRPRPPVPRRPLLEVRELSAGSCGEIRKGTGLLGGI